MLPRQYAVGQETCKGVIALLQDKCYCHVINGHEKSANVECARAGISALGDDHLTLQVNRTKTKLVNFLRISSLTLVFLLTMVLIFPVSVEGKTTKEKLDEAKKYLSDLESELEATQTQLNDLSSAQDRLSDDLSWLAYRTEEQNKVYQDALQQRETAYAIMLEDETAYQQSLQKLSNKQEEYGKRISQMYKWQSKSLLELLLSSDSLQSFFTTVRFMKVVSDADEQALDDLESATKEAETMRLRSENSYNELKVLAEEADAVLQQIKADQEMTQGELDEALYSLSLFRQKEENLTSIKDDAKADVDYYTNQYATENKPKPTSPQVPAETPSGGGGSAVPSGGSFAWPVPSSAYITSYFGWRGWEWHQGVDIAAGMGSNVIAARGGTVTYAGWLGGYGNLIIVDHGDGYSTRYAHLSAYNCYYGQSVSRGQVIGFIGSTGNSTGPHLHFEILTYGTPTNPLSYY
jgi:murein DD-endopeptidase MepM/ murein hydrolase activator NlpD